MRDIQRSERREVKGLVYGNGGFLTKHAVGIYSTRPPQQPYTRRDPSEYEDATNDLGLDNCTSCPNGTARIVGWTVEYGARPNRPVRGIIIGEMVTCAVPESSGEDDCDDEEVCEVGQRFVANTPKNDPDGTIAWMLEKVRVYALVQRSALGMLSCITQTLVLRQHRVEQDSLLKFEQNPIAQITAHLKQASALSTGFRRMHGHHCKPPYPLTFVAHCAFVISAFVERVQQHSCTTACKLRQE